MSRAVIVRPDSEAKLTETFRWYERQFPGLGSTFLLSIDATIQSIRRTPQLYPIVHKEVHGDVVRRFLFGVFYLIEQQRIVILAVFHARRDPRFWQSRA